jgi:hypothetical protein
MQVIWMVVVTLVLTLSGVLGLALVSHAAAWTRRRESHRPGVNRTTS